jgi:hypothetical protein
MGGGASESSGHGKQRSRHGEAPGGVHFPSVNPHAVVSSMAGGGSTSGGGTGSGCGATARARKEAGHGMRRGLKKSAGTHAKAGSWSALGLQACHAMAAAPGSYGPRAGRRLGQCGPESGLRARPS